MHLVKKTIRMIIGCMLVLMLLGFIGILLLVKFVDPNDYKPQIISYVEANTGRHLSLPGTLSWSFYPYLGIHIGTASLSNPNGFSQSTFAQIDSADLVLNLPDLLVGKIAFDRLNLNGLRLFLIEERGQNSWTFTSSNLSKKPRTDKKAEGVGMPFSIDTLTVTNGGISYDNYSTKAHYVLNHLNLSANQLALSQKFPLSFSADFSVNPGLSGNIKLNTQINFDPDQEVLTLNNLALQTVVSYETLAGQAMNIATQYTTPLLKLDLAHQTLSIPSLSLVLNQILKANIAITGKNLLTEPLLQGQVQIIPFSLNALLNSLAITPPPLANKTLLNQVALATRFTATAHNLNLSALSLKIGNSEITGSMQYSWLPLTVRETLAINQLDLADFMDLKGARLPLTGITSGGQVRLQPYKDQTFPRTLTGLINLSVQSIVLKGFDLHVLLKNVEQLVRNPENLKAFGSSSSALQQQLQGLTQTRINPANGQMTDLGSLKAKINIRHGVVTTPLMQLQGPDVTVKGSGSIDLSAETLNYQLMVKVLSGNSGLLKSLTVPYELQGSFSNLHQGINWPVLTAELLQYLAKVLGQNVQQLLTTTLEGLTHGGQDVGASVKDSAEKALDSIFGGGH